MRVQKMFYFVQVEGPSSDQYNGYGFQSEASVRGSYTQLFTEPGTYYYITEGLAHIGMEYRHGA